MTGALAVRSELVKNQLTINAQCAIYTFTYNEQKNIIR